MAYKRTNWVESETTLGPTNLNNIEDGIEEALAGLNVNSLKEKLVDVFYPVGSYYETSNRNFNPNAAWGGTWVLETAGRVHVAAGSGYTLGSTGGAKTHSHTTGDHKLTAAQSGLPAHRHSVPEHGHSFTQPSVTVPEHGHSFTQPSITGGSATTTGTKTLKGNFSMRRIGSDSMTSYSDGIVGVSQHDSAYSASSQFGVSSSPSVKPDRIAIDASHNHTIPSHTHTASGGKVGAKAAFSATVSGGKVANKAAFNTENVTAAAASQAHNHGNTDNASSLPPYIAVNIWHRTA